ncbi:MAG: TonB-dependent receptor [Bacteroidia bacterium]|nr:MAG: TonB-dependent receptor [Bacteroidia bacterium]
MKKLILLCLGTLFSLAMFAQRNVKGTVLSAETNLPISGASVVVKSSNLGTVTDEKGAFQLNVPQNYSKLVISAVGYDSKEIGLESPVTVVLDISKANNLDEVLVVGYGTKIKKDVTSSISRVAAKDFQEQPVSTFEQALQGRSSGVFINAGSGKLGQGLKIRVRGISSISANQQPFVVIDGVPVVSQSLSSSSEPDNPLATLNPDDIESIEVLKDASSSAIYGARASNGVLLVTTKSGKKGKTKVNFGVNHGWTTPTHYQEFLNADQYRELFTAAAEYSGYDPATDFEDETGTGDWNDNNNTNWSRAAFQNGYVKQYTASLSGGDAKTRFLASGSYNDQKGIIIGNRLARATGRLNLDHSINTIFKVGANLSLNQTNNYRVSSDNAFSNPVQLNALPPLQPMYDKDDGLLNRNTLYYNSLIEVEGNNRNINKIYRTISSGFIEANILSNLKFRTQNGIDWTNLQESNFLGRRTEDGAPGGYSYEGQTTSSIFTSTNTLSWVKGNDNFNVDALAGIEYQNGKMTGMDVTGKAFPSDKFTRIASAAIISGGSSSSTQYRFLSYFLRTNLKLYDKYLIGASVRADGSSRFSKNKPYGVFPAISAGWIISEEKFLQNSNAISFLKLRSSFGRTGNAEIGNFSSLTLFSSGAYANVAGIIASQIGDPNLSWEKTDQFDIGLDFGFAKNRISGEIDYFFKNTKDLLLNVPLPSVNGFTSITKNIGDMENRGIEFVLNADIVRNTNFKWTSSFNISTYRNKVTRLVAPVLPTGRNLGRLAVGAPFGQFYTKKYMGVDPANGDALYMAADGSKTNDYSAAVDTAVGNPNPDYFGGWNNKFSYKGFELNLLFQFVKGGDIYNLAGIFQSVNGDYYDNQTVDQMKYWKKPGDITDVPQPRLYEGNGTSKSSRWVQDGSYLRFKSVTLNYNLPKSVSKKIGAENVKVFVSGQNLLTSTKYTGYDPEVNTQFIGSVNLNHDFYTPPLAKTFLIGINIDL